jgi:hypothetical protein
LAYIVANKSLKQENLQLAVFTAFNILANYKFPLNEALYITTTWSLNKMLEFQLTMLIIVLIISFILIIYALTGECGPTWTQRLGICFSIVSIALGVFSSEITTDMWMNVLNPYINNISIGSALFGAIIGSLGEVIWKLIHPGNIKRGEILKSFVIS